MSIQENHNYKLDEVVEEQVVEYLRAHPDFFAAHPQLLMQMNIPHDTGGAISLLEHQLRLLREHNNKYKSRLLELVQLARENDRLSERINHLTLALIKTRDINEILSVLKDSLHREFQAGWVRVRLFQEQEYQQPIPPDMLLNKNNPQLEVFEHFFKVNRPLCGRLKREQLAFLFEEHAEAIQSAVLIPLGKHGEIGMLAIGSSDAERFHPGMGTIFLNQMGAIISAIIHSQQK